MKFFESKCCAVWRYCHHGILYVAATMPCVSEGLREAGSSEPCLLGTIVLTALCGSIYHCNLSLCFSPDNLLLQPNFSAHCSQQLLTSSFSPSLPIHFFPSRNTHLTLLCPSDGWDPQLCVKCWRLLLAILLWIPIIWIIFSCTCHLLSFLASFS